MEKKNQQMNTNESNIRNMLASLLYMKKTNSKQSKEIIKKISSLTSKEKLYQSLRIELNYLKELNNYYWKDGEKNYHLITEVDLMYRIRTANDDFTEFEWELKESNLYKEE